MGAQLSETASVNPAVATRSNESRTAALPWCDRGEGGGEGEESAESGEGSQKLAKKGEELKEEMDSLMDEIDSVLEENAEEFVKNYVQRGGQ